MSLYKALVSSFPKKRLELLLDDWFEVYFPLCGKNSFDNKYQREVLEELFEDHWPQIPPAIKIYFPNCSEPTIVNATEKKIERIKELHGLNGKIELEAIKSYDADLESLQFEYIRSFFIHSVILSNRYQKSSLKNFKSRFKSMIRFCQNKNIEFAGHRAGVSLALLAKYFNYIGFCNHDWDSLNIK